MTRNGELVVVDPTDPATAHRVVEIQLSAYAVEAELIGFNGIPQLSETADDVATMAHMDWRGIMADGQLAGIIAWESVAEDNPAPDGAGTLLDIDRLAIDPAFARRGFGRQLVQAVPTGRPTIVSTGTANTPARNLYLSEGFVVVGETEVAPEVFTTQFRRG